MPKVKDEVFEVLNKLLLLAIACQVGMISQVPRIRDAGEQAFKVGHSIGADCCTVRRSAPGYLGQEPKIALEHSQSRRTR